MNNIKKQIKEINDTLKLRKYILTAMHCDDDYRINSIYFGDNDILVQITYKSRTWFNSISYEMFESIYNRCLFNEI